MATIVETLAGQQVEVQEGSSRVARNIILFLAAPWVGLAYIIVFPFVGFGALLGAAILRR